MFCCLTTVVIGAVLAYLFLKSDANPMLKLYELIYPNKNRLRNKTVWVVGSSTGIGESLAHQLAELNCRLILTSTSKEKLEKVKAECLKRSSGLKSDDILVLAYDISDFKENEKALKQIINIFGDIDVVINNAARVASTKIIHEDMDLAVHKKIFDINYFANIHLGKLITQHWVDTKSTGLKTIAVTSSVGSYADIPFVSPYVASKKALNAFYRDLALQHRKDGVTCCLIMPGPTESAIGDKALMTKEGSHRITMENEKMMSSERCAELMIISVANRLAESWISENPWLLFTYISERNSYYIYSIMKYTNLIAFLEKRFYKQVK